MDLCHPLQVGWYNGEVEAHLRLPDFGRPDSLALVIGNTRTMWPRLLDSARVDRDLLAESNPVERYAMAAVERAMAGLDAACEVRWAHTLGEGMVAMQRLAHVAGLAYLSPAHLSIHPVYGPWVALRAVVVVEISGPPDGPPVWQSPCDACATACVPALRALSAREPGDVEALDWVAVRDACPLGREYRYSPEQIEYHYSKNVAVLRDAASVASTERGGAGANG